MKKKPRTSSSKVGAKENFGPKPTVTTGRKSSKKTKSSKSEAQYPPPPPSLSSNASNAPVSEFSEEPEDLNSLVSFYRKQCENNEKQIADLVQSISDLDPAYEELSKVRLEAEKKTSEITRLHTYASSLNSAIIEEKEKSLSLQGEVERLKVVEMELSKENQSLLDKIGGGRGITREEVRNRCTLVNEQLNHLNPCT